MRSNEEIATALDDLLKSEGWLIVCEGIRAQHGAEQQLADIDQALRGIPPSEVSDFQGVIVPQIRAASKAALAVLAWPESRIRQLKAGEAAKQAPKLYDRFRRGPRHA